MQGSGAAAPTEPTGDARRSSRWLAAVERIGNRLPDPAALFVLALIATWVLSKLLAPVAFEAIDPRNGAPLRVVDQLTGPTLVAFLSGMVKNFAGFPPLGMVLVALLGIGVAEHVGLLQAGLRALLAITARKLLTPMAILVAILSHTAGDAGFVLVIPLGGVIYHAAGRHPLAGIAATFAGVSGGLSASLLPCALDPLLQGFTQSAAQIIDPARTVNPLCNWYFNASACFLIVGLGWWLTDRWIEPRLARTPVDAEGERAGFGALQPAERRGLFAAAATAAIGIGALVWTVTWPGSPWRSAAGLLTTHDAPLMQAIVPLIFALFLAPAVAYGVVARTIRSHRDVIDGMSKTMGTMAYYLVLAFFAAQFIAAFNASNLGALLAVEGALALRDFGLPPAVTILGVIALSALVDLVIGSASAKWALLAPILVPMMMQLGLAPELVQAGYRIGDSCSNLITPLMSYFPLVVVYCQRWTRSAGVGTLVSLMLPYSVVFLLAWSGWLLLFWATGLPLGLQSAYAYP